MAVPQGRNQKKARHKRKLQPYMKTWNWRLEDGVPSPGDRLGEMLSRPPMSGLDRPGSFLGLAEDIDPQEVELQELSEDFGY